MDAAQRVLLIDIENAVGSVNPRPDLVRARVGALVRAAGSVHPVLACYSQSDPNSDAIVSVLAEMGIPTWLVTPGTDAAETALLSHARYVHARGCRAFSVASADHQFTALAELGEFDVIAWTGQKVSGRLHATARQVRRVPRPSGAAVGPSTRTVPVTPVDQNEGRAPNGQSEALFAPRGHRLVAALAIGVGIALGNALVDRLVVRVLRDEGSHQSRRTDIAR
ncbi:hypothetical protein [Saccharothrix stipae]